MRVFTDFHHASLLNSLIMLFEGRLGGRVYRPIGKEWFDEGYWKVYDHPATVEQFLGIGGATPDGTDPVNSVQERVDWGGKVLPDGSHENDGETYYCHDIDSGFTNRAITYKSFMESKKWDYVIASIPQHIEPFRRLCDLHPSHPKLIFQIGNAWNIDANLARNLDGVMSSALLPFGLNMNGRNGKPLLAVTYHQEFDLTVFTPRPLPAPAIQFVYSNQISSFVNCFSLDQLFAMDWGLFQQVESQMPGWVFKCFGGQCRDGAKHGSAEIADEIRHSMFVWHTKVGGDGYGHIIHNVSACGRPLIVRKSQYQDKMADALLIDGETCINIDGLSIPEIIQKIEHFSQPDIWREMCQKTHENFKRVVNFDAEFKTIQYFLDNL
jgi:hypothetical protein